MTLKMPLSNFRSPYNSVEVPSVSIHALTICHNDKGQSPRGWSRMRRRHAIIQHWPYECIVFGMHAYNHCGSKSHSPVDWAERLGDEAAPGPNFSSIYFSVAESSYFSGAYLPIMSLKRNNKVSYKMKKNFYLAIFEWKKAEDQKSIIFSIIARIFVRLLGTHVKFAVIKMELCILCLRLEWQVHSYRSTIIFLFEVTHTGDPEENRTIELNSMQSRHTRSQTTIFESKKNQQRPIQLLFL